MITILGTGRALPRASVDSTVFDERLSLPAGHLADTTGVQARYVCEDESQVDLALAAAQAALGDAGLAATDIDLVICGAAVPYQPIPATAPLLMQRLGMADGSAMAFDVNATCLGFVSALDTAARLIATGGARRALVVSAEIASRALPWQSQPDVAALFGDGAGAAVVEAGGGLKASLLRTYPSAYDSCSIGAGGTRFDFHQAPEDFAAHAWFHMDGKALFRLASRPSCYELREHHILARIEVREEMVELVHEAEMIAAQARACIGVGFLCRIPGNHDLTAEAAFQQADRLQQRRLARPRGPEQCHDLAGHDLQIDPAKHVDPFAALLETAGQAFEFDDGITHSEAPVRGPCSPP